MNMNPERKISRRNFVRLGLGVGGALAIAAVEGAPSGSSAQTLTEASFLTHPDLILGAEPGKVFGTFLRRCITRLTIRSHRRKGLSVEDQDIVGVEVDAWNTTTGQRVRFTTQADQGFSEDGNYSPNMVVSGTDEKSGLVYGNSNGEKLCKTNGTTCDVSSAEGLKTGNAQIALQEVGGNKDSISYIDADCPDGIICDKWDNWNVEQIRPRAQITATPTPTSTVTIESTSTAVSTQPPCFESGQAGVLCDTRN